jgi:hypothetical protein
LALTVGKWRRRFAEAGLAGLADGERSGRPKAGLELTATRMVEICRARAGQGEFRVHDLVDPIWPRPAAGVSRRVGSCSQLSRFHLVRTGCGRTA